MGNIEGLKIDRNIAGKTQDDVLVHSGTDFSVSEAYKSIRTNLMFLTGTMEGCKKIAFTSPSPGEGKTINCINLAITVAQTGAKVLVVDADLRRPRVHSHFDANLYPGLSNLLTGYKDSSCICSTNYDNLYVITSGQIPPNPAEILASKAMGSFLEEMSKYFDYVFIDTPPVNVVTDVAVLSKYVDGNILIARQNKTKIEAMRAAVISLEQIGAGILGVILNDVRESRSYYSRRYRYKRGYGKYSGYGDYYTYGGYGGYDKSFNYQDRMPDPNMKLPESSKK